MRVALIVSIVLTSVFQVRRYGPTLRKTASRMNAERATSEFKKTPRTRKQLCFHGYRASLVVEREKGLPNP
ncbi:hypothetical protein NDU88_006192 [Pleurodeles waltl]|uniref:Secreted protein n=1 Tax=Pleurodeles waltl TaxID=8319 RepID=A0AAV7RR63_PLEWA|nr:hypothetical protein NDU88_006192 [Pleurodeles waltl]